MVFVLDPQIIVPSFNEAISQLVSITLNRLGININSLPFWLSVVGYPLVMFEVFTKHIATALNVILRKAHTNTINFLRVFFQFLVAISILTTIGLTALYNSEHATKIPSINHEVLVGFFKYTIAIGFVVISILLLSSLSYLTGQGNQVAGIGFILSTTGLFIEARQNFGFTAEIVIGVTSMLGLFLWFYGNKYNKKMAQQSNKQENIFDGIQRRRKHLREM